jgi:general secretion pathway protein M
MNVQALPKIWRRVLALSLVGLALGLAALVAIVPFSRAAAARKEMIATRDLVARQERIQQAAAGPRTQGSGRELLLAGATSGLAGAELQRLVSELSRQSGLTLRSTQVTSAKREADLAVVSVDAGLQGGIEGLRALLHSIETGVPMLFVEALSIRTVAARQVALQPVSIDITLKVRGYGAGKNEN